jgi:uncharacterized protein
MSLKKHAVIFCIVTAIIFLYGFSIERYALRVNTYPLYFENLPAEFDGYRVLVLADLHYGLFMPRPWVREILKRANGAGADLIVGVGDYVKKRRTRAELDIVWPMLKTLRAPDGVWFVNGNHEHWADSTLSLQLLEESGFSLRYRHRVIRKGGAAIAVAGCGEIRAEDPGLEQTLAAIPGGLFTIVLAHNPVTANLPHRKRVDLFLCGHTHGGQIVVPLVNFPVMITPGTRNYDSGLKHNANHEAVFISRGIGWGVVPLRINCLPELAIIELRKKKRDG